MCEEFPKIKGGGGGGGGGGVLSEKSYILKLACIHQ